MNARRVTELKIRYITSLMGILRTICDAGDQSEEHMEAIRQVEWSLLNSLNELRATTTSGQPQGTLPRSQSEEPADPFTD